MIEDSESSKGAIASLNAGQEDTEAQSLLNGHAGPNEEGAMASGPSMMATALSQAAARIEAGGLHSEDADKALAPSSKLNGAAASVSVLSKAAAPSLASSPAPSSTLSPTSSPAASNRFGVVIYGGPKGESPEKSIESVKVTAKSQGGAIVFVTDEEASEAAQTASHLGADIVVLQSALANPGRARNAGYRRLKAIDPDVEFVQFLEAGFVLSDDWLPSALRLMQRRPEVAVVEGHQRDHHAEESILHRMNELSRLKPDGELQAAGAVSLVRVKTFESVGGFRGDIDVNDHEDLCIRIRRRGQRVWRANTLMGTLNIERKKLRDWWRDARRNGYNYAHGAALHGAQPERFRVLEQARALVWGGAFPVFIFLSALFCGIGVQVLSPGGSSIGVFLVILSFGVFVYAAKILLVAVRYGIRYRASWAYGVLTTFGHFGEFLGVAKYYISQRSGKQRSKKAA